MKGNVCGCCGGEEFMLVKVRIRSGSGRQEEQWRCGLCLEMGWDYRKKAVAEVPRVNAGADPSSPPEPPSPVSTICHHNFVGNTKPCECCTCGHPHLQRDGKCGESLVFDTRCHCPRYEPRAPGRWGAKGYYWAKPVHGSPEIVEYDGRGGMERMGRYGLTFIPVHGWVPLARIPEWTE